MIRRQEEIENNNARSSDQQIPTQNNLNVNEISGYNNRNQDEQPHDQSLIQSRKFRFPEKYEDLREKLFVDLGVANNNEKAADLQRKLLTFLEAYDEWSINSKIQRMNNSISDIELKIAQNELLLDTQLEQLQRMKMKTVRKQQQVNLLLTQVEEVCLNRLLAEEIQQLKKNIDYLNIKIGEANTFKEKVKQIQQQIQIKQKDGQTKAQSVKQMQKIYKQLIQESTKKIEEIKKETILCKAEIENLQAQKKSKLNQKETKLEELKKAIAKNPRQIYKMSNPQQIPERKVRERRQLQKNVEYINKQVMGEQKANLPRSIISGMLLGFVLSWFLFSFTGIGSSL